MVNNAITSRVRNSVNTISRMILRESIRKMMVENYYAAMASRINMGASLASHTGADLIDWRKTLGFRFECSREVYRGNSFYGAGHYLKQYSGISQCVKACIEHGVYFGNYVNPAELDGSELPCLVTFSKTRARHVGEVSSVPVITIGPYIAYATEYITEDESSKLKEQLGKTLLVFPSHSIDRVKVDFIQDDLFRAIDQVVERNNIDTVLISLYYRDLIENAAAESYENRGYTVVCSGYREDRLFLSRLRSLIKLADITMSNNVGTHVGYCAHLNKPHWIFSQNKIFRPVSSVDSNEYDNQYAALLEIEKAEVADAFSSGFDILNQSQLAICNQYWGFDEIKTSESLARIFSLCEQAYAAKPKQRQTMFRKLADAEGIVV